MEKNVGKKKSPYNSYFIFFQFTLVCVIYLLTESYTHKCFHYTCLQLHHLFFKLWPNLNNLKEKITSLQ